MHAVSRDSSWRRRIRQKMASRLAQGLYRDHHVFHRDTRDVRHCFASNDYLGMRFHSKVVAAMGEGAKRFGTGSGSSALMSGYSMPHKNLEQTICDYLKRSACLLFPSGYMANLGVVAAFGERSWKIFADKHNHASLVDACLLAHAETWRFPHLDYASLSAKMNASRISDNPLRFSMLVTDGIFSMSGHMAHLPRLIHLAAQHDSLLIVDDAHGFGVLGPSGGGVVEHFSMSEKEVPILIATFGKAVGVSGAFVAGDKEIITYLVQFCRTYIFTTALSPAIAHAATVSLQLVAKEHWRREKLWENIATFCRLATGYGLNFVVSDTPIMRVVLGDNARSVQVWHNLEKHHGISTALVRPPTVENGESGLRISLSSVHEEQDIHDLVRALVSVLRDVPDKKE